MQKIEKLRFMQKFWDMECQVNDFDTVHNFLLDRCSSYILTP